MPDGTLTVSQAGAQTVLRAVPHRGAARTVRLPAEDGIYAGALWRTTLVGMAGRGFAILTTEYGSRPGGPMLQCGGGIETVLRVVALHPLRQRWAQRIESCWSSIESGTVHWDPAPRRLSIERTRPEAEGIVDRETTYALLRDGTMRVVATRTID